MKKIYARLVLWLIRPALHLARIEIAQRKAPLQAVYNPKQYREER